METINPMSLKYLFEEELFFFSDDTFTPTKSNDGVIGENKSKISILSKKPLDKSDLQLLEKILIALKLSFSDVAINTNLNVKPAEFIEQQTPKTLLLFGLSPYEAGFPSITMSSYEILEHEGIKILNAEDFEKYSSAPDKKKALWFALQKLFT